MSAQVYTVGDLVADFLSNCGVEVAYGIASVHNVPLLDAIGRRNAIRFVTVRGEMGGGHMADAHARVTGGLGVLITSTGPGAANAMPALVEARFAGSPLLHITGLSATRFLGRDAGSVHEVPGQTAMLSAAGKACFEVRTPAQALPALMAAVEAALSPPRGPVTVELAIDVQRMPIERPTQFDDFVLPRRPPPRPAEADLDRLAAMVTENRRPMLWLGNGAREAGPAALRLLDLGFGAVTSWNGRGIVPDDHGATLGALHGSGSPGIERFYESVDLMLVAGSRLRAHETLDHQLALPPHRVQIDIDPVAPGRGYGFGAYVHGDAALVLHGLADRLEQHGYRADPVLAEDLDEARKAAQAAYRDTLGPYASFAQQLRKAMPRDTVFVRDATVAANTWGHRLVPLFGPRDSVHSVGAAIGLGLPLGIGAALAAQAQGRKAVALVGDGGFALSMNELWTAVQERANLTIVVMNDGIYAAIGHIQDSLADGRRNYLDLLGPDLMKLAELAGIPGFRVDRADEFGATVATALACDGPSLVEVDMRAIGPAPSYASWGGAPKA
jgi:acetolactate synthase-1/2/3 large subunit